MALPTATDLYGMDFAYNGDPFITVPAKTSIAASPEDWAYNADPLFFNPDAGGPPSFVQCVVFT